MFFLAEDVSDIDGCLSVPTYPAFMCTSHCRALKQESGSTLKIGEVMEQKRRHSSKETYGNFYPDSVVPLTSMAQFILLQLTVLGPATLPFWLTLTILICFIYSHANTC